MPALCKLSISSLLSILRHKLYGTDAAVSVFRTEDSDLIFEEDKENEEFYQLLNITPNWILRIAESFYLKGVIEFENEDIYGVRKICE